MEYIKVVAAVIKQDDKILIARRKKANILSLNGSVLVAKWKMKKKRMLLLKEN